MPDSTVLCYIIAFDVASSHHHRNQARICVASLLRSGFQGDIKLIHNGATEIFPEGRPQVEEIGVELEAGADFYRAKYQARSLLDVEGYDWVLFLDCDCLVMGPLDGWFTSDADILYAPEKSFPIQHHFFSAYLTDAEMASLQQPGVNSGSFLVKAHRYHEIMTEWERLDQLPALREHFCCDQPAWNRLLLDTPLKIEPLSNPTVTFFYENRDILTCMHSPLVHFCGVSTPEKTVVMQATYLARFLNPNSRGQLMEWLEP